MRVGGEERLVAAGEEVEVAPGTAHFSWNAGDGDLHHVVTLEPALDHERFFESVYGLAHEGFSPGRKTRRNLLLAGLFASHDNWLAGIPVGLQRAVFPPSPPWGASLAWRSGNPSTPAQAEAGR